MSLESLNCYICQDKGFHCEPATGVVGYKDQSGGSIRRVVYNKLGRSPSMVSGSVERCPVKRLPESGWNRVRIR